MKPVSTLRASVRLYMYICTLHTKGVNVRVRVCVYVSEIDGKKSTRNYVGLYNK